MESSAENAESDYYVNKNYERLIQHYANDQKAFAEDLMRFGLLMKTPPICGRTKKHAARKKGEVTQMVPQSNQWRWICPQRYCRTTLTFSKRSFLEGPRHFLTFFVFFVWLFFKYFFIYFFKVWTLLWSSKPCTCGRWTTHRSHSLWSRNMPEWSHSTERFFFGERQVP